MLKIQVETTITVKDDRDIAAEVTKRTDTTSDAVQSAAGQGETKMSKEDEERYAVASGIANVCEYLTDGELIKIKLIIKKADERKMMVEGCEE